MGKVLQCALISFLAIANVFAVLIFSDALFQTFAASMHYVPKSKVIRNKQQHKKRLYLAEILHFGVDNALKFETIILTLCSLIIALSVSTVFEILCLSACLLFQACSETNFVLVDMR
jgi:hypothetical protein